MPVVHVVLDALEEVDAVVDADADAERDHRQRRDLEADAERRHQRVAEDRHDGQRHDHAEHGGYRAEREQAQQRQRAEDRQQHRHLGGCHRLVGRGHHADVAGGQAHVHTLDRVLRDEGLDLVDDVRDRRAVVVLGEDDHLDRAAAFVVEPQLGSNARSPPTGRPRCAAARASAGCPR